MITTNVLTYEKTYFSLWELAQRYRGFTEFRVIGESHDQRLIPMLEIGKGDDVIFCLSGLCGMEREVPAYLVKMAEEYCQAYEYGWILEDFYDLRELLNNTRLCFIPILNPDGYEICQGGFRNVRNPIFRQMLRMQRIPREDFIYNARAVDIRHNFPTTSCKRRNLGQEPGSENETKALMRVLQEYQGKGLLSFIQKEKRIVYYHPSLGFSYNQRNFRLAKHLQKCSDCYTEKLPIAFANKHETMEAAGSPEQFYAEKIKKPSLEIEIPTVDFSSQKQENKHDTGYEEIRLLPLEYIYSLEQ